jgi:hypothetical protein
MGECDDEIEKPPLYAGNFSFAGRSIVVRIDLQGRGVKGEAGFDGALQEVRNDARRVFDSLSRQSFEAKQNMLLW